MKMRISDIGEFGLIKRIGKMLAFPRTPAGAGIGDDCAALPLDRTRYLLLTCDTLVEGVDFRKGQAGRLVGRKAVASVLSDIAACAGIPRWALVTLGLPRTTPVAFVEELYRGMRSVCRRYGVRIVGGDMSRSPRVFIAVSMAGIVEKKNLVLRSGAQKGDGIFVTGSFGRSIAGKHLRFTPRLKEARFLVRHFKVNAMIDVSDGLLQDLGHILEESRVGAAVHPELVPRSSPSVTVKEALSSGEEFELLFTVPQRQAARLRASRDKRFTFIGRIEDKRRGLRLVSAQGRKFSFSLPGWRHF